MNRHLSRIIAMQSLYEWDFRPEEELTAITQRNIEQVGKNADKDFIEELIKGVIEHMQDIDDSIIKAAPEWPLEQISVVDKTILRLAIFELIYCPGIPPKVAINEAVELGKNFGGENSSKFINGVLGTLYRSSERYSPEDEKEDEPEDKKEDNKEDENENTKEEIAAAQKEKDIVEKDDNHQAEEE